jgi:hypothetical protein
MTERTFILTYGREARVKHSRFRFRFVGSDNWWTEYFVDHRGTSAREQAESFRRTFVPFAEFEELVRPGVLPLPD